MAGVLDLNELLLPVEKIATAVDGVRVLDPNSAQEEQGELAEQLTLAEEEAPELAEGVRVLYALDMPAPEVVRERGLINLNELPFPEEQDVQALEVAVEQIVPHLNGAQKEQPADQVALAEGVRALDPPDKLSLPEEQDAQALEVAVEQIVPHLNGPQKEQPAEQVTLAEGVRVLDPLDKLSLPEEQDAQALEVAVEQMVPHLNGAQEEQGEPAEQLTLAEGEVPELAEGDRVLYALEMPAPEVVRERGLINLNELPLPEEQDVQALEVAVEQIVPHLNGAQEEQGGEPVVGQEQVNAAGDIPQYIVTRRVTRYAHTHKLEVPADVGARVTMERVPNEADNVVIVHFRRVENGTFVGAPHPLILHQKGIGTFFTRTNSWQAFHNHFGIDAENLVAYYEDPGPQINSFGLEVLIDEE